MTHFNKEVSAVSLLLCASLLGSLSVVLVSGCRPAASPVETSASTDSDTHRLVVDETPAAEVGAATEADRLVGDAAEAHGGDSDATTTLVSTAAESASSTSVVDAGGDWPQWGGTFERNNTPGVKNMPLEWNVGKFDRRTGAWDKSKAANIRWYANLGSQTYGNPVVSGGRVFVGTNNGAGHIKRYPSAVDLGCLLAFDEATGEFLWQHSSEKLHTGRVHDWPLQGICSASMIEGDRLWFVTSRGEVRCLDTQGFHDGEDDGPVKDESAFVADFLSTGPTAASYTATVQGLSEGRLDESAKNLLAGAGEPVAGELKIETVTEGKAWKLTGNFGGVDRVLTARQIGPRISFFKSLGVSDTRDADVIWVYDMMAPPMSVSQHNMCSCSVTCLGDLLFVNTSNGLDESHLNLPAPDAPSFVCMDKNTGEVFWTDKSPGTNIHHGQWSSPAVGVFDGVPQVLFAGGDAYLYGFRADRGTNGSPELLWKFDCNPKTSKLILGGEGTRNDLIATPVVYNGLVYIAVGQDPEHGEGEGRLWCIDPTKRGDISPTLAMKIDDAGNRVPIAHKRMQAVVPEDGEVEVDNPNSGVVWQYDLFDGNGDGEIDFEEQMHRTIGTCAIKDDVLYVTDLSGLVHCLDARGSKDGKPVVHFTYDMLAQSWGSPLIADGHVFVGDEDGDVAIFEFGAENKEPIAEINMGSSVYTTPVAANDTLFISSKDKLFSIALEK